MFTAYVVMTLLAAAANTYAAAVDFSRSPQMIVNMDRLGVPQSWMFPLGAAKAVGAVGLLVGLAVPAIGAAAAVGLVLFFTGAIVTVVRARWWEHLPYPATFLLLPAASLILLLAS